jgi:DNA-binding transcriptional MerR regulator
LKVYRGRVTGYRISELAERTGFPASTLRYYEQRGLLPPVARTSGGYRSYDEHAVERLRFITRAKQLDLPLGEIRELAEVWDDGACAPVQHRLAGLIDGKIAGVDARVAELTEFRGQLMAARAGLGRHTPDGPCDEDCGCVSSSAARTRVRAVQLLSPGPATPLPIELTKTDPGPPITCTLDGADQETRMRDWRQLLQAVTSRQDIDDGIRLTLPADPDLIGQAARLAALEQACCRFFTFAMELTEQSAILTVRAPADAAELLHAMFAPQS